MMPPPELAKSTMTVTPVLPEQAAAAAPGASAMEPAPVAAREMTSASTRAAGAFIRAARDGDAFR